MLQDSGIIWNGWVEKRPDKRQIKADKSEKQKKRPGREEIWQEVSGKNLSVTKRFTKWFWQLRFLSDRKSVV